MSLRNSSMVVRQVSPVRIGMLCAGLLLAVTLAALAHHRHRLMAFHDSGFTLVSDNGIPQASHRRARPVVSSPGEFMTLDSTGRFLMNSITDEPVFMTGDSAWSLITQLDNEDVEFYLSHRAEQGFNYIWCAAADNYYQVSPPKDYYGDSPFDGPDFTHEDPHYWAHVDDVLHRAAAHGITVALDPGFVGLSSPGGYLTSYLRTSDDTIRAYGEFLGERYKAVPNLIWALGGDVDPATGVVPKLAALASGIRSADKVHLIVGEGQPQHAALDTFGSAPWMDLNWLYFHTTNIPDGVSANYGRSGWPPPFLGESWYENDHSMSALQLREQGYWAVLSGAFLGNGGFGNSPLWYFGAGPAVHAGEPTWKSQLNSEGSLDQMYLGRLFRSREHWKLVPDLNHTVMTAGYDSRSALSSTWERLLVVAHREGYRLGSESAVAARTADGQTIIAYIPAGNASTVAMAMDRISDPGSLAMCWWFNPRSGASYLIGTFPARETRRFTPPDRNDWVLVIDSRHANLSRPGSSDPGSDASATPS